MMREHMIKRPFFPTLAICLSVLVAGNFAMMRWSHRLPSQILLKQIRTSGPSDLLFIGNSLLAGHVDAAALNRGATVIEGTKFKPLNAALGASEAPDQALLMEYAREYHPETKTLAVGFFDFQLTKEEHLRPTDLTGNHVIGIENPIPLSEVAEIYQMHGLERAELSLLRAIPMAANRKNIWKYVELMRRRMEEIGMPHQATNSMGRAGDFSALEARSPQRFDAEAEEFLRDPSRFNSSYERIFSQATQAHMRVILILMPMSPSHRSIYYTRSSWISYFTKLKELARQRGFAVIDASNWLPEEDRFVDRLHMSPLGFHEFSFRIGRKLAELQRGI
jgi:hypothetical protein